MAIEVHERKGKDIVVKTGQETVYVDEFVNGILDPTCMMLGPVRDGGHIVAAGPPDEIAATPGSHTGRYLADQGSRWQMKKAT